MPARRISGRNFHRVRILSKVALVLVAMVFATSVAGIRLSAHTAQTAKSVGPEVIGPETVGPETIGIEVAVPTHLEDGEEYRIDTQTLLAYGAKLFAANWTSQEGGGRPLTKGTGASLSDPADPLVFPRNFNRISAPDANACSGCHNAPFGIAGGGGDFVANVFVLGQRFDFATFDHHDLTPTKGAVDESGNFVLQQTIANSRATIGMFGSGFIEMLARQMTADLQTIRDATRAGESRPLVTKGIAFGSISRHTDGTWDVSGVEGLAPPSLVTTGPTDPPSLIIRPFHQAGAVVSLRVFTNNAFNHHHGMQAEERFGLDTDLDGDGFVNELTRADVTAVTLFQATMAPPGRVIPNNSEIEAAVLRGEVLFDQIGCSACHVESLPLYSYGWIFTEPNPYNPSGNLQVGAAPKLVIDLTDPMLPSPRLTASANGVVYVPAFTDLKLHDITRDADDPNIEPLDMNQLVGSSSFLAHNNQFLTRKLWGIANEPPYFHHGQFTTMREAIANHFGEANDARLRFLGELPTENVGVLDDYARACIIEFLKTLQVLPPGTESLVVDENGNPKQWPPMQR